MARRARDHELTGARLRIDFTISALSGRSCRDLGRTFGVDPSTAHRWKRTGWFRQLSAAISKRARAEAKALISQASREAVMRLRRIVRSSADDEVARRACRDLLEAAGLLGPRMALEIDGPAGDPGTATVYQTEIVAGILSTTRVIERIGGQTNGHGQNGGADPVETPGTPPGAGRRVERLPRPEDEEA